MKSIVEYLDDLKEKTGSDYKSAKLLNVKGSTISMIRSRGQMADETAVKVADLLGVDRGEILIAAAMARSEGETKSAWNALAKRLSVAAGWVLVAGLSWHDGDIRAAEKPHEIYIMR
ncbi:hypothetical protein, partial [Methylomonas koyamae]|uniref:hypothetical protein n=1 Tax=Methylomonas koyamae TaxID=702114 RepID=UPI00112A67DB